MEHILQQLKAKGGRFLRLNYSQICVCLFAAPQVCCVSFSMAVLVFLLRAIHHKDFASNNVEEGIPSEPLFSVLDVVIHCCISIFLAD